MGTGLTYLRFTARHAPARDRAHARRARWRSAGDPGGGDSLTFRYGTIPAPVRGDVSDPNAVLVVDASGEVQQQFMLVKGRDPGSGYLHDGVNVFRRIRRQRPHRSGDSDPNTAHPQGGRVDPS